MQSKLVWENAGERTFVLVLDAGEEALPPSPASPRGPPRRRIADGAGRFERATVGWFDLAKKTYKPIEIDSQCEG